ncbi:hypothetical protein ABTM12_19635, partial [Acinetobacter baumannii]
RLLKIADNLGFRTVEDLHGAVSVPHVEALRFFEHIAAESSSHGFIPFAVPADICILLLYLQQRFSSKLPPFKTLGMRNQITDAVSGYQQ